MSVVAIVLAAGRGSRMQVQQNKVFLNLAGRPVLVHTLLVFQQSKFIDGVLCVCRAGEEAKVKACVAEAGITKCIGYARGGATRQESVSNGLRALPSATTYIAIHDGARPLVTVEKVDQVIREAQKTGAATLAVPVKDTIKVVDLEGIIRSTPCRSRLWATQTPQVFERSLIEKAHQLKTKGTDAVVTDAVVTDDASLIEKFHPVTVVQGSYTNIKITTPADLTFAEAILRKVAGNK